MPIIQTMLGGASGKYWVLDIAGDTVNSIVTDMFAPGGLALDSSDNIYFISDTREESGTPNVSFHSILFKVDKNGQLQFQKKVGSSNSGIVRIQTSSNGRALGIDSDGYLYGSFRTAPTQSLGNNDEDSYIVMFDTDGNADTGVAADINYRVYGCDVAVRSDDYVYHFIDNSEFSGAGNEPYLIFHTSRTHQSNALAIGDQIRLNDYNWNINEGLVVDSSDNAIVAGSYEFNPSNDDYYIYVQKFSGSVSPFNLSRVWDKHIYSTESGKITDFHFVYSLATDSSDNIYIIGTVSFDLTGRKAAFIKLNSSGVIQWARQIDNTVTGGEYMVWQSAVVNSNGDLYACSGGGSSGLALLKYNSSGTLQWVRSIDTVDVSDDLTSPKIKLDSNEDLIIGAERDDLNNDDHTIIIKMPSDGSLNGTYGNFTFTNITSWTDEVCNVAIANSPLTTSNVGPTTSYKTPTTTNSNYATSITLI